MGIEPTTSTLARSHSTAELHPHADGSLIGGGFRASQESPGEVQVEVGVDGMKWLARRQTQSR